MSTKAIVIKLSALGDVLATTAVIRLLAKQFPDWRITHCVMTQCAEATRNNPHVHRQYVMPLIPTGNLLKDVWAASKLLLHLLRNRYDIGIVLHRSATLQLICRLGGVRRIVSYRTRAAFLLDHAAPFTMDGNRSEQEINLLRSGGFAVGKSAGLEFYIDTQAVNQDKLKALPAAFVAINVGGGNPHAPATNKFWPLASYIELIKRLSLPVVLLGNGASDATLREQMRASGAGFTDMVGKTNLHETAAILQASKLFLGNDSGLLYLGAALGVKTLGLYGPTSSAAFNPLGKSQHALQGVAPCAPCYSSLDGIGGPMYTCKNNLCMQSISVDAVISQVDRLLNG
jgi:lipopolysaccharide heptosyltransferase II